MRPLDEQVARVEARRWQPTAVGEGPWAFWMVMQPFCRNVACSCFTSNARPCDEYQECFHPLRRCAYCGWRQPAHEVS